MNRKQQPGKLSISAIDPHSSQPLYSQIADDLRQLIATGALHPLDMLPTEKTLCKQYGVGRHTVRMAMAQLVQENLISRRAGSGTIVKPVQDRNHFYLDKSFSSQLENMGMKTSSRVISTRSGSTQDSEAPQPSRAMHAERYFYMERLRYADNIPISIQHATVNADLCPGIEHLDFSNDSLYRVLTQHFHLSIERLTHTINAAVATEEIANWLGVAVGAPVLLVKTGTYLITRQLIEYSIGFYRSDRYEYTTTFYAR
jgi:GntR family transcriptional regulator